MTLSARIDRGRQTTTTTRFRRATFTRQIEAAGLNSFLERQTCTDRSRLIESTTTIRKTDRTTSCLLLLPLLYFQSVRFEQSFEIRGGEISSKAAWKTWDSFWKKEFVKVLTRIRWFERVKNLSNFIFSVPWTRYESLIRTSYFVQSIPFFSFRSVLRRAKC